MTDPAIIESFREDLRNHEKGKDEIFARYCTNKKMAGDLYGAALTIAVNSMFICMANLDAPARQRVAQLVIQKLEAGKNG